MTTKAKPSNPGERKEHAARRLQELAALSEFNHKEGGKRTGIVKIKINQKLHEEGFTIPEIVAAYAKVLGVKIRYQHVYNNTISNNTVSNNAKTPRQRKKIYDGKAQITLKALPRRRQIYDGKAKTLFQGPEPGTLVQHFKDDATAFNNKKHGIINGKGVINNRISAHIMSRLAQIGVPTHFIRRLNMREQLVRSVDIIPLEVVARNIAAGSIAQRLGLDEGDALPRSIIEYYYKNDDLGDPMICEEHATAFGWATPQEMDEILSLALRINDFLSGLFLGVNLKLVDFKMEFGRLWEGDEMRIVLADEISPDSCRLWDVKTNEKRDKDRFRRDLGNVEEAYQDVARRLGILPEANPAATV